MNKTPYSLALLLIASAVLGEEHDLSTPASDLGSRIDRRLDDSQPTTVAESCLTENPGFFTEKPTEGNTFVENHYGPFARIVKNDFDKGTKTVVRDKVGAYPVMSPKGNLLIHNDNGKLKLTRLNPMSGDEDFLSPELQKAIIQNHSLSQDGPRGVISEDEKTAILRDHNNRSLLVIDIASQKVLQTIPGVDELDKLKLSKDGRKLAVFSSSGTVSLWDTKTGKKSMETPYGSVNQPSPGALSDDGKSLAVARKPGDAIEVLDNNGESVYSANLGKILGIEPTRINRRGDVRYRSAWAQFIPGTKKLVAGLSGSSEFVILNERGKVEGRFSAPESKNIYHPVISADGKSLFVDGMEKTCRISLPTTERNP
jgi:WD40 repeat protein